MLEPELDCCRERSLSEYTKKSHPLVVLVPFGLSASNFLNNIHGIYRFLQQ